MMIPHPSFRDEYGNPLSSNVGSEPTATWVSEPWRIQHKVLERIARAICAAHHACRTDDGYTNTHWPAFLPGARAAYYELLKIDQERANQPETRTP